MGKLKWVGLGVGALVLVATAFVLTKRPALRPAPVLHLRPTPELVSRGEYLYLHALACNECHAKRDWTRYGGPNVGLRAGGSDDCWGEEYGIPGKACFPNLTSHPSGLGNWSDGEVARAIREGVTKDGQALFPLMPYASYASLSDQDTEALVAYLRTLPHSELSPPRSELTFPVSFFVKFEPKPLAGPVPAVDPNDALAYGGYLARVAGCRACHTPVDSKHQPIAGRDFSGGQLFVGPFGTVRASNLTPDPKTGLRQSADDFVARFHSNRDKPPREAKPNENTVMPWLAYAGMQEQDLRAIYTYLRSVPPIENAVLVRPE